MAQLLLVGVRDDHGGAVFHSGGGHNGAHEPGPNDSQPDLKEERKGPKVDAPEKAVEGFLRSVGMTRDEVAVVDHEGIDRQTDLSAEAHPVRAVPGSEFKGVVDQLVGGSDEDDDSDKGLRNTLRELEEVFDTLPAGE